MIAKHPLAKFLGLLLASTLGMSNPPPNVVFIMADDMGYGDLGSYGATDARTPHLDRLAREGVRFTQFYSNGTECSPTRTALFSGQYQQRIGGLECAIGVGNVGRYDDAIRLAGDSQLGLPVKDNVLLAGFRSQGYESVMLGKWHLGYERYFSPLSHGFDRWFGIIGGNSDYFHYVEEDGFYALQENDEITQASGHVTDLIADRAVSYLNAQTPSRPFFLYLPFTAPHTPIQGPDDYALQPVAREVWNKGTRAGYVAMVEQLDQAVGMILDTLETAGLAENTLVIFKSDNGGTRLSRNDPFSGGKGTTWEGGIRVPCIVRWPGHIRPGTTSHQTAISMDLSYSIRRIIGATDHVLPSDGVDIIEHITQENPDFSRTLFWRGKRGDRVWRAVREGHMKYMSLTQTDKFVENVFDLSADPAEKTNLTHDRPQLATRLKKLLKDWELDVVARR
ncbi:MAG: sulfatase-like hydrolase/transferase [Synoicihabitans sp.]